MNNQNILLDLYLSLSNLNYFGDDDNVKSPYTQLGDSYELRPIEILAEGGKFVVENREKFSQLYYNNELVCDKIFREGGSTRNFKDGYSNLIYYTQKSQHTKDKHGFDYGVHVIINQKGDIVLSNDNTLSYPSHLGGNIGRLKDTYYNLITGKPLLTVGSGSVINGKDNLIIEHMYQWYDEKLPLGVYMVNKKTCEINKIDEINK